MVQRGNTKVRFAYRAMANIGIPEQKVKPVLKKLLKLYDKNWELIEEENYRALADAIFQEDDEKIPDQKNKSTVNDEEELEEEAQLHDEPEPLKRLHMRSRDNHVSQSCSSPDSSLSASNTNKLKNKNKCIDPQDKFEESEVPDKPERQLKRLRTLRNPDLEASKSSKSPGSIMASQSLIIPKIEVDESFDQQPQNRKILCQSDSREAGVEAAKYFPKGNFPDKNKPMGPSFGGPFNLLVPRWLPSSSVKVPPVDSEVRLTEKDKTFQALGLISPKNEPIDFLQYEAPIKMMYPENGSPLYGQSGGQESQVKNTSIAKLLGCKPLVPECRYEVRGVDKRCSTDSECPNLFVATVPDELDSNLELASSSSGEVQISLSCSSALGRPDFVMPSQDQLQQVIKKMEENCLSTYKIISPKFSLMKLLTDTCECFLELGTDSSHKSQEGTKKIMRSLDHLQKPAASNALIVSSNGENLCSNPFNIQCATALDCGGVPYLPRYLNVVYDGWVAGKKNQRNCHSDFDEKRERKEVSSTNCLSLVPIEQHEVSHDDLRSINYVNDLTRGEENVKIPWINEVNNDFPPTFSYTAQNLKFNQAHVLICLAQIREEDCCSSCCGNCLLSTTPCACAYKLGDSFAYTYEGLVKEDFLEECIAISRNPKGNQYYCKDCPVEKSKGEDFLEPCKGHLRRKFIKECWSKCGCSKQCGNRVVQQGITCNLQVFFTSEGKKWGLRTLSDLPKGAFVCEYVGEILTNKELHERSMECRKTGKHMFPVLLDAEWDSGVLKDEEALCLETSSYSNIARFINHRCWDSNLIEIPVEVETPDQHYYHLALFTSREVAAFEELTWDYGINFDDLDSLMKTFLCKCGSKFCRNMKRSNRLNRAA